MWEKAQGKKGSGHKLMIWGPPGCWKTRLMLRLGSVPRGEQPTLAVLDSEYGTRHYSKEFNFVREYETEFDAAIDKIDKLREAPGSIVSLGIDSYTVLDKSLVEQFVQLYLKRLPTSAGHKSEFYVLQPNDHQPINRERDKFVRKLWTSEFNIIMIQEVKNQWEGMKVVGTTLDAPDRFKHFFDTTIEIMERGRDLVGFRAKVHKDRTNILQVNKIYDWDSEEQAYELLKGFNLTQLVKGQAETTPVVTETKAEPPKEEKPEEKVIASHEQLQQIKAIKNKLHIVDKGQWTKMVKKINGSVESAREFTPGQANKFIQKLESMLPSDAQVG